MEKSFMHWYDLFSNNLLFKKITEYGIHYATTYAKRGETQNVFKIRFVPFFFLLYL